MSYRIKMLKFRKRKVAIIAFYDKKKRILMQDRRSITKFGEEWGFFGGGMNPRETPEQALKREIKEELNYNLKKSEFKFFKKYGPRLIHVKFKSNFYFRIMIHFVFIAECPKLSEFKQVEGEGMKFFTFAAAKKLKIIPGDYIILKDLEKYFKKTE